MKFDVTHCTLCPRKCGADRTKHAGICGGTDTIRAARAALHFWEEPCISGTKGSGTIFFTGCPLHCRFCQNAVISSELEGKDLDANHLEEIILELQEQGAHNINLVTAGHFLPWIIPVLEAVKPKLRIPIIYNTGGYELTDTLHALDGLVDIYLPDYKFYSAETARQYAAAPDYPEIAEAALKEMLRQTGKPVLQEDLLKRGCIVRHLVLPGHRHESMDLMHHLSEAYGTDSFLLSLMAQYTPMQHDLQYPELNRRITKMEYRSVADLTAELGFQGYSQDKCSADQGYTPDFNLQGL